MGLVALLPQPVTLDAPKRPLSLSDASALWRRCRCITKRLCVHAAGTTHLAALPLQPVALVPQDDSDASATGRGAPLADAGGGGATVARPRGLSGALEGKQYASVHQGLGLMLHGPPVPTCLCTASW
jgi:hypothetical protein